MPTLWPSVVRLRRALGCRAACRRSCRHTWARRCRKRSSLAVIPACSAVPIVVGGGRSVRPRTRSKAASLSSCLSLV
eukprot:scaffold574662_cov17-Prasinocladus_malaysianus.AAC.1